MNIAARLASTLLACLCAQPVLAQAHAADGLVRIESRDVDEAWLLPGADFRPYRRIMLATPAVAVRADWLRDMNDNRVGLTRRVSAADARELADSARLDLEAAWTQAFRSAGYEVVASPGPDVLAVSPGVVDLYANAPEAAGSGHVRSYAVEAGVATLRAEARDSLTGRLLARIADRRETARHFPPQRASAVTNRAEFDRLFATWAAIAARGLGELKAGSPLPADLRNRRAPAPG